MMLPLGSGCKYRSLLAERFHATETIINQLLTDSYQNPISESQVKIKAQIKVLYSLVADYKAIPPPPWCMEKSSSTKLVPGAKKVGNGCINGILYVHMYCVSHRVCLVTSSMTVL